MVQYTMLFYRKRMRTIKSVHEISRTYAEVSENAIQTQSPTSDYQSHYCTVFNLSFHLYLFAFYVR